MAEERTKYTAPIKELLPAGTSAQLEFLNESLTVGLTQAIERMKKNGELQPLFDWLLPLVENGYPEAEYFIALLYERNTFEDLMLYSKEKKSLNWGRIPRDSVLAVKSLNNSFSKGYPPAISLVGSLHLFSDLHVNGRFARFYNNDEKRGLDLLEKAARLNYRAAPGTLMSYHLASGNYSLAFKWGIISTGCSKTLLRAYWDLEHVFPEMFSKGRPEGGRMAISHFTEQGIICNVNDLNLEEDAEAEKIEHR